MTTDTPEDTPLPGMPEQPRQRPRLSAAEAARRAGVGRATISRALDDGRIVGAEKTEQGWRIPVESLLAAGFRLDASTAPPEAAEAPAREHAPDDARPDARIAELEEALAREQARRTAAEHARDLAEQVAAERASHLADLRMALRLIEAPRSEQPPAPVEAAGEQEPAPEPADDHEQPPAPPVAASQPSAEPEPKRRSWWRRLTGG
jgi:hypothetical protein